MKLIFLTILWSFYLFNECNMQYNMDPYLTCWEQNHEDPTGFRDALWGNSSSELCIDNSELCTKYQTQGLFPGKGDVCDHPDSITGNLRNMCYFNVIFLPEIDPEKSWTYKCWHDSLCPLKDNNGDGMSGCLITEKRISCCCDGDFCNGQQLFTQYALWGRPDHYPTNFTEINTYSDVYPLVTLTSAPTFITLSPSEQPTTTPTQIPTISPTSFPTQYPSIEPTINPTLTPSTSPTNYPTKVPTNYPSKLPTISPTQYPSIKPSKSPSFLPTKYPTHIPSQTPTISPTRNPTYIPTKSPTLNPSQFPTVSPTPNPTNFPTVYPTFVPSKSPTIHPSYTPTMIPSYAPTVVPTYIPSLIPTIAPSVDPTQEPSYGPSIIPTRSPSNNPTQIVLVSTEYSYIDESVLFNVDQMTNESIVLVGCGVLGLSVGVLVYFFRKYCKKKDNKCRKGYNKVRADSTFKEQEDAAKETYDDVEYEQKTLLNSDGNTMAPSVIEIERKNSIY